MKEETRELLIGNIKMALGTVKDYDLLESDDRKIYKKIIKRLKEGEELTQDDLGEILSLGYTLAEQSFYDETMACYESILRLEPKNQDALRAIADFHHENGDMGCAIEAYNKVLELYPNDGEAYQLRGHNHYFNNEWMLEHFKEKHTESKYLEAMRNVVTDFEKAIELGAADMNITYLLLSKAYKALGMEDKFVIAKAKYDELER